MSVVAVKNWSKPQHLSWSASSIPASSGTSCTLSPLQSIIAEMENEHWNTTKMTFIHHRRTRTVRAGSREVGGSSTRWVHLQCAGFQLSHPLASLWLSYACKAKPVTHSDDQLFCFDRELIFFFLHLLDSHNLFIFAWTSIGYEGKTPTGSVVKCHANTPQVNIHSVGFLMGLAQHGSFIHIWVLQNNARAHTVLHHRMTR